MKVTILSLTLAGTALASPLVSIGGLLGSFAQASSGSPGSQASAGSPDSQVSAGPPGSVGSPGSPGSQGPQVPASRGLRSPFHFTSTYSVVATPDQVVNASDVATGGLPGAMGWYHYGINSHNNVICYNITISGFRGNYSSPAVTATHIHEAPVGKNGPPRIAFPNPVPTGEGDRRNSVGCVRGPFTTGVMANGADTGAGFHVRQIEANPSAFFTDVHSSLAVAGAVRGQLNDDWCKEKSN